MNFIYDISVSTIAAGIFYYFQVRLPEEEKKTDSKRKPQEALEACERKYHQLATYGIQRKLRCATTGKLV